MRFSFLGNNVCVLFISTPHFWIFASFGPYLDGDPELFTLSIGQMVVVVFGSRSLDKDVSCFQLPGTPKVSELRWFPTAGMESRSKVIHIHIYSVKIRLCF